MKGILPRPRRPFERKKDRASPEALAAATREPKSSPAAREAALPAHLSAGARAQILFRDRLAAQRRENLRSGTLELEARYKREKKIQDKRSALGQAESRRRLNAPEREDERLTAATARASTTPLSAALQKDPHAAERLAARRARYNALEAIKRERRADAMHMLYQQAGNFIVDEQGLRAAVDAEFDAPFYQANPERGIWDAEGFPETLQWLVAQQATRKAQYAAAMGRSADLRGMNPDERLLRRGRERADRVADLLTRQAMDEGVDGSDGQGEVDGQVPPKGELL